MESSFDKLPELNRRVNKITRKEKEQRHVEWINDLIDKRGYKREIIMPQNHQQDSDASGNINILDSIGQGDVSSPQILPCEFKNKELA